MRDCLPDLLREDPSLGEIVRARGRRSGAAHAAAAHAISRWPSGASCDGRNAIAASIVVLRAHRTSGNAPAAAAGTRSRRSRCSTSRRACRDGEGRSLSSQKLVAFIPHLIDSTCRRRILVAEPGNCFQLPQPCNAKERLHVETHSRRPRAAAIQALIVALMPALAWAGPVDINTADAATIAKELQGIGLSRRRRSLHTARRTVRSERRRPAQDQRHRRKDAGAQPRTSVWTTPTQRAG